VDVEICAEREGQRDEAELRSLLDWLRRESPRPWRAELVATTPQADRMGGAVDALHVALGAGGAVAVLAHALSTWLATRRGRVRIRIRDADGNELLLDAEVEDPDALAARLARLAGGGDDA